MVFRQPRNGSFPDQYWLLNTKIVLIHAEIHRIEVKILVWGMGIGRGWEGVWLGRAELGNMGSGSQEFLTMDNMALGGVRSSCALSSLDG